MCGRRSYEYFSPVSHRSRAGPDRRNAAQRVSDADRERVVDRLRVAAGEGRLEIGELEQRIEAAYGARTGGELHELVTDLPRPERGSMRGGAPRAVALGSTVTALLPLLLAVVLLALAPPAIAWIGWPILGWWCFACLPAAGAGFAWCGYAKRRQARRAVRFGSG